MKTKKIVMTCAILAMLLLATLTATQVTVAKKKSAPSVYFDDFWFDHISSAITRRTAFIAGDIEVYAIAQDADIDALKKENIGGTGKGAIVEITDSWQSWFLGCNEKKAPFNDPQFRKALYQLVPKRELIAVYVGRLAEPIDSMLPPSYGPWHDPTTTAPYYDPELAKLTLNNAGYHFNSTFGYWCYPNGTQLPQFRAMDAVYSDVSHAFTARWISEMRAIGLDVVPQVVANNDQYMWYFLYTKDFECSALGGQAASPGPWGLYIYGYSTYYYNVWNYNNTAVDALLDTATSTSNKTLAIQCTQQADKIMVEQDFMWLPMYMPRIARAWNPGLMGINNDPDMLGTGVAACWRALYPEGGGIFREGTGLSALTLNPGSPSFWYGTGSWAVPFVAGALIAGFYDPETYEFRYRPWIAWNWTIEDYLWYDYYPAQNITFYLRDDVIWHDGVQYTAQDVVFAFLYGRDTGIITWPYVIDAQNWTDFKCSVQVLGQSVSNLEWLVAYATMYPKHIWNNDTAVYGGPAGFSGIQPPYAYGVGDPTNVAFKPWLITNPLNSSLTCLTGTGVYYFPNDGLTDLGPEGQIHLKAFRQFFKTYMMSDRNGDFVVNVLDLIMVGGRFGKKDGEPGYTLTHDMNDDLAINILDLILIAVDFGLTW